jgi:GT2 family glycosyltransferase
MGRGIYCVPESFVYHVGGGTLPKNNSRKTFLNFRNNLLMLFKNLEGDELSHVMRVRWFLDYLAAYKTLLCGNYRDFKAIYQARREYKKMRASFADSRAAVQRSVVLYDIPERSKFSILVQYYIKGRKLFSQLP